MIKKIAVVILLLLVLGFYFYPDKTKDVVDTTGNFVKDTTVKVVDDVKNSDEINDFTENAKDGINQEAQEIRDDISK